MSKFTRGTRTDTTSACGFHNTAASPPLSLLNKHTSTFVRLKSTHCSRVENGSTHFTSDIFSRLLWNGTKKNKNVITPQFYSLEALTDSCHHIIFQRSPLYRLLSDGVTLISRPLLPNRLPKRVCGI